MKLLALFVPAVAIGLISGLLAALCGVGGGIIMVPAFGLLLKLEHRVAVATSMAVIVPTAIAAVAQHIKNDLVNWQVFAATAIAATLTSYFAADYVKKLSNETLTRVFAVVVILIGIRMLFPAKSAAVAPASPATASPAETSADSPDARPTNP